MVDGGLRIVLGQVIAAITPSLGLSALTAAAPNLQRHLREAVNPMGATVTANVVFKGKGPIPVRYVLVYRDGKVISEVWQINPPKS